MIRNVENGFAVIDPLGCYEVMTVTKEKPTDDDVMVKFRISSISAIFCYVKLYELINGLEKMK